MIKFRFLLWALGLLMAKAAKKNPAFQKQLAGKDLVFQLQTLDGGVVRHYAVQDQKVKSKAKAHPDLEFSISFKDAKTGVAILTSKDKNAFLEGIKNKDITLAGDFKSVMWFQGLAKLLKTKKKPS